MCGAAFGVKMSCSGARQRRSAARRTVVIESLNALSSYMIYFYNKRSIKMSHWWPFGAFNEDNLFNDVGMNGWVCDNYLRNARSPFALGIHVDCLGAWVDWPTTIFYICILKAAFKKHSINSYFIRLAKIDYGSIHTVLLLVYCSRGTYSLKYLPV